MKQEQTDSVVKEIQSVAMSLDSHTMFTEAQRLRDVAETIVKLSAMEKPEAPISWWTRLWKSR